MVCIVLATCPGNLAAVHVWTGKTVQFSARPGQKPEPLDYAGFLPGPDIISWFFGQVVPRLQFHFTVPATFAPIKFLSSDHMRTWSVHRLYSFSRSFTSQFQICDPTDIRWVGGKTRQILTVISGFSRLSQRILVGSQIWKREVKERLELHNLHTDHVMIRSEFKYLIGAKVVMLKCRVFGGKTGPIATVRVFVW